MPRVSRRPGALGRPGWEREGRGRRGAQLALCRGSPLSGAASVLGLEAAPAVGCEWRRGRGRSGVGGPRASGSGPHGQSPPPPRIFFDSCHGFFTNYNWREEHLDRMVAQAGERRADVYVGVDVFARGNVVGGQFDTHKVGVALGAGAGVGAVAGVPSVGLVFLWTFRSHLHSRETEATFFPEWGN